MKKKSLLKDTFREIAKSRNRFLSIMLIVLLGVGFFTGVKATAPSIRQTADKYFNKQNLMDIEILSTVGFGDADVDTIKKIDGVERVMPAYSFDAILDSETTNGVVRLLSLPSDSTADELNNLILLDGRFPEKPGECVTLNENMLDKQYKVGDTFSFKPLSGDTEVNTVLERSEYTVVGIVESPLYFSYGFGNTSVGDGDVLSVIYVPSENFLYSRYTEMYVSLNCHKEDLSTFDDGYDKVVKDITLQLQDLGEIQYSSFVEEKRKELEEAQSSFEEQSTEANQSLEDAKTQLDDAKSQIDDAINQITSGWDKYNTSKEEADTQLNAAATQLNNAEIELNKSEAELIRSQKEYEDSIVKADSSFAEAKKKLDAAAADLAANRKELNDAQAQYNSGYSKYQAGEDEYAAGLAEYNQGLSDYNEGVKTLEMFKLAKSAVAVLQGNMDNGETLDAGALNDLQTALPYLLAYAQENPDLFESTEISSVQDMINAFNSIDTAAMEAELDAAKEELDAAKVELDAARAELDSTKAQLAAAKKELNGYETRYAAGKSEYDASLAKYNKEKTATYKALEDAKAQIAQGKIDIEDGRKKIEENRKLLEAKAKEADIELKSAKEELEKSEAELAGAKEEYEAGLSEYEASLKEAEDSISDGESRIQLALSDFSEIESGSWYVLDRDAQVLSYSGLYGDSQNIDALADVFPVFFLMVAALVCLTTMSRMVDEKRQEMGTYKALGYSSSTIASKYILYALFASIIGSVIGAVIGILLIPKAIFGVYKELYYFSDFAISIPWLTAIIASVVALLCTVMVAWYSCNKELRIHAATLMRVKPPKSGKQIWIEKFSGFWKVLNFSQKNTIRNIFRSKVRMIMTVFGVAGCMSLIVAGFGLQDAIAPIANNQYGKICKYNLVVSLTAEYDPDEVTSVKKEFLSDDRISSVLFTRQMYVDASSGKSRELVKDTYITVPDSADAFPSFIAVNDIKTGAPLKLTDDGVIITDKLASKLGLSVGDSITTKYGQKEYSFKVTGISENYIYHYIYMTPAFYEETFGKELKCNSFMAISTPSLTDINALKYEWLEKYPDVLAVTDVSVALGFIDKVITNMNSVILLMISAAGALAFVVVFNLTNINISERTREIATIKVLGFKRREVNTYIFQENLILAVFGVLFGCVGGYYMVQFIVSTIDIDMITMSNRVEPTSFLYAALLTAVFTLFVNFALTKKMHSISMVESLKAIE